MKALRLAAITLILAACQPATPLAQNPTPTIRLQDAHALWGHAAPTYRVQAVESDLKPYGTVSLLDTSNNVVATGTTDGSGNFNLNPFVSWTPTSGAVYALELTKRFESNNEGSLLRMRTLVSWSGTQWASISGTTASASGGSGVLINSGTTAIAAIQSLRALTASNMLGSLDPNSGTFTPGSTGIAATDFTTVKGMVGSDLAADLDPVRAITWSVPDGTYLNRLENKNGNLLFDLKDAPTLPGTNPTPIRTKYGTGYAVASSSAGLYLGQFGSWGTDGGDFEEPMDIAKDRYGNLYITNFLNNRVDKFDPNGNFMTSFGTYGTGNGQFNQVTSVAVDPQGNLWVVDYSNHRVQKLDPNGNFLMGIGEGTVWTSGPPPTPAAGSADSWFSYPHYTKVDRSGNIWVSDASNFRIQEFAPNGTFIRGIGNGTTWTGAAPAPAPGSGNAYFGSAPMGAPVGFDFDAQGNLWVCDRSNNRVEKFDSSGNFLVAYGSAGSGNGQFNANDAIAIDGAGNLWVSDYYGQRIEKFDPSFNYLGQISSAGATGSAPGTFNVPRGLNFDSNGNLLAADWSNHRVQRFAPATTTLNYNSSGHFNLPTGTVEAWIRPSWSGTTSGTYRFFQAFIASGSVGDGLSIYKTGSNVAADFWPHTTGAGATSLLADMSSWTPYTDHHVAVTWDGGNRVSLYVDGGLMATRAAGGQIQVLASTLAVGSDGSSLQANAIIESCRVYDYAKSLTEIRRDYGMVEQY